MTFSKITNRSLYRQVADALEADFILPGKIQAAFPPENELAARYHVSITTIRKAVDLLEEKGQVKRRQGSGTYIVRNQRIRRLALLIDHNVMAENASSVTGRVFRNLHYFASQEGFQLTSYFGRRELGSAPVAADIPEAFFDALKRSTVDGVIAIGSLPFEQWVNLAKRNGIPVVGNSQGFESTVCWDEERFLRLALETARLNGKQRVAMVAGVRPQVRLNQHSEKTEDVAYSLAAEYGLSTRKEWIRSDYSTYLPGAGWELFRDLWSAHEEKPDCLIANEFSLCDIMDAAIHAGIKPVSELLIIASSAERSGGRYPYPYVRISTANDILMARTLLDEMVSRTDRLSPRHLLIPPTQVTFEQQLYSQIPAIARIIEGVDFEQPVLPGMSGQEEATVALAL